MSNLFRDNRGQIKGFVQELNTLNVELENRNEVIKVLNTILERIDSPFDGFDICQFNIKEIGEDFIGSLNIKDIEYNWNSIVSDLIRFCKEFELRSSAYIECIDFFIKTFYKKQENNPQIYYAYNKMLFEVLENMNIQRYSNYQNTVEQNIQLYLEETLPTKNAEINDLKIDYNKYEKLLKGFKQKFNFIVFNKAFNDLENIKQEQLNSLSFSLKGLGSLIVLVPFFFYFFSYDINLTIEQTLTRFIPLFFIVSILIYYFKILLNKYNSVSDQIVQLETKQAIMQFIESYVDYKKDKGLSKEELSKFEDVIFSQISPNLKDIPTSPDLVSLFDGISKVTNKRK